ncbi:MAG: hypothetical protein ACK528_13850 [Alphaproteobacteria bacterium]|jgi:hypothetical protein
MLIARSKLETEGVTAWDKNLDCKVEHRKRHPAIWWLVAFLAIIANVGLATLARMPNKGIRLFRARISRVSHRQMR